VGRSRLAGVRSQVVVSWGWCWALILKLGVGEW
jgi:hypothetical protein